MFFGLHRLLSVKSGKVFLSIFNLLFREDLSARLILLFASEDLNISKVKLELGSRKRIDK